MKIAVLCSDGPHNKYLISEISKSFDEVKIFVESGRAQLKWKLKNKKYKQYLQLLYQLARRRLFGTNKFRQKYFETFVADFKYIDYDIVFVDNINEKKVADHLSSFSPDVTVVMGTSIIHNNILKIIAEHDIINIHGGYLPYYKGNHCFFFAFYNKEFDKIGSTIHYINDGIDTGDIIERVVPDIQANDTPESLYCKAEKLAVDRLIILLKEQQHGKIMPRQKQENVGHLYYTKDRKLYHDIIMLIRGGKIK